MDAQNLSECTLCQLFTTHTDKNFLSLTHACTHKNTQVIKMCYELSKERACKDTEKEEKGRMITCKDLLRLTSYKWSKRWGLVAAPCFQRSRAAGLHAPGRGLAGKAASPWATGGATAHSVNPAHKSSWRGQRREARSNTSEDKPRGREASRLVWIKFLKTKIFLLFFPGF